MLPLEIIENLVCRKHASIGLAPLVFDFPIADEDNKRVNSPVDPAILFDDPTDVPCVPARLHQWIVLLLATPHEQSLAVPKFYFALTASEFCFDRENASGPDHHVIDVVPIPDQIVEGAISGAAKVVEYFSNPQFSALTAIQSTER